MSPKPKNRTSRRASVEEKTFIPDRWKHVAAIAGLFLALVVFLYPVLYGGKSFLGPDSIASHSFDTFLHDAEQEGIFPLWNPYVFGGMPAYGSLMVTGNRWFDLSARVYSFATRVFQTLMANSPAGWVVFNYLVFGIGWYLLIYDRLKNSLAAFLGSFAILFAVNIIIWIMASHNTKIATLATFPYLLFIIERLRYRFSPMLGLLAAFLLHFMFMSTHVQMIYYSGLAIGAYLMVIAVRAVRKREPWSNFLRPGVVFAVATVLAFAMDSDRYLSVLEYSPYSIRGSAPIVQTDASIASKTSSDGLDYDYATQWSFAPGELMTFVVPTWYGFGQLTYEGPLTTQPVRFNGYWGPQPFTDAAHYMGIVVLILAIVGFLRNRRDPFVLYLTLMIGVALLISFGREFPVLFDPLFSYLPFFNKFRSPSMILVIVQMFVPILAAYGVASLMQTRSTAIPDKENKRWTRGVLGVLIAAPAVLVLRSPVESFYKSLFPLQEVGGLLARQFGQVHNSVVVAFYDYVVNVVVNDIVFACVFVGIGLGALHFYRSGRLSLNIMALAVLASVGADLWRIDYRPMNPESSQNKESIFAVPPHVSAILADSSHFRTLTIQNGQLPYDNTLAYWRVENAYGYHGAKMRAYQDVVDVAGMGNPFVWQLMNVKYIFSNTPDSSAYLTRTFDGPTFDVYWFEGALPRAFFVNEIQQSTGLAILDNMKKAGFDPRSTAFMMDTPPTGVEPPTDAASVIITDHGIQNLTAAIVATGTNAIFFSETWYPEGWKARLDGEEIPILRFNYLFRGVVVPPGEHTLTMSFEPSGFELGKTLSLIVNILLLSGLAASGFVEYRNRSKQVPTSVDE